MVPMAYSIVLYYNGRVTPPQHRIARSWGMANARPSVSHSYTPDRAALERLRTALAAYDDATGCT